MARRGTGRLRDAGPGKAAEVFRSAAPAPQPELWIEEPDERDQTVRAAAGGAVRRGRGRRGDTPDRQATAPDELEVAVGAARAPKLAQRLKDATRAYERDRFGDARTILRPLAQKAPGAAAVRELHGLTLYRLGQWRAAMKELEAFAALTGTTDQHPVIADCARALHQWTRVDELWDELRSASPSAEIVTEGRIVAAGALADRGKIPAAISLLEEGRKNPRRLRDHHVRLLYALADLHERAGDVAAARGLFRRVAAAVPDFADVATRIRALR